MCKSDPTKKAGAATLGLLLAASFIQAQTTQAQDDSPAMEEVVITGYRGSLLNSTLAKRESIGFSDEVFSDDIGKMPSQNLAESLNRIPGVRISREVTGEGQQITVRGLGPDFTKVVINNNPISVASDGSLGSGNRGRHVDLDMFPPELFSSLAVNKTATAEQVEGGVAGYVNMRTMRASDMGDGSNFRFGVEGAYNEMAESINPRLSFMYGNSTDKFGVLVGVVNRQSESRVDGFETIGDFDAGCEAQWWTNDEGARVTRCVPGSTAPNTFNYTGRATPDYAAANPGVNVGDPIDLNAVSGLTDEQIDNFRLPYIARPMYTFGDRDTTSALLALEFNFNDDMRANLDLLHAQSDRDFLRNEAMVFHRRNYLQFGLEWIPQDIQVGADDVITSGTFWNNRAWIGSQNYQEELTYTSFMPSFSWQITDLLRMDTSYSHTTSDFDRDAPYILYFAPAGQLYFAYDDDFPTITHTADLANVGPGWTWGATGPSSWVGEPAQSQGPSFRFQRNSRETTTDTFKLDFALGEDADFNGFKFGLAYDESESNMTGYNSDGFNELWQGTDLETNFTDYLVDSPVRDLGDSIDGYTGINGIVSLDWSAVKNAIGYDSFTPTPDGTGDQFGQTVGDIKEEVWALYLEANSETEVAGRTLRTNMGVRWVDTDQTVATVDAQTEASYTRLLPSLSAVYDLSDDIKLRASGSRSLTRANPSSMFPTAAWNGSGIDQIAVGNPELAPFESTNFDIGGEWYFSELGYVGLTYYEKDITGFTRTESEEVQFLEVADYGVDISEDGLTETQESAIAACGGPASPDCVTTVVRDVNIDGTTKLSGVELIWVMPLDMLVEGLGFNASMNKIDQSAQDPDAEIPGISDSHNFTVYYERDSFQSRLTYTHVARIANFAGAPFRYSDARAQLDLSASYDLPWLTDYNLTLTFDAYNMTNEPILSYVDGNHYTYNAYYPGATYTFGLRGSF